MKEYYSTDSVWEKAAGFSRAVREGDDVFVSGTTGFDYATGEISDDPVAQTHRCFENVIRALAYFGASLDDVVRVRYYAVSRDVWNQVMPVFGEYFADSRPAATGIIAGLVDERMLVEIEVTARLQTI